MKEYDKFIVGLRHYHNHSRDFLDQCADALAALTARVQELERDIDHIKQVEFPARIDKVTATFKDRAKRAEAERDALRAVLQDIADSSPSDDMDWHPGEAEAALKRIDAALC